jgi:hypothetical protein
MVVSQRGLALAAPHHDDRWPRRLDALVARVTDSAILADDRHYAASENASMAIGVLSEIDPLPISRCTVREIVPPTALPWTT